jgi:hypothetical protein
MKESRIPKPHAGFGLPSIYTKIKMRPFGPVRRVKEGDYAVRVMIKSGRLAG